MKKYKIEYLDCGEKCTSVFAGYDAEHAEERFYDSFIEYQGDTLGIKVISVNRLVERKKKIFYFFKD